MATRSQAASQQSKGTKMSETRRERLLEIQKREQLKGMLVNKFKLKYGNKPHLTNFIDNEVQRFLANDRLTELNLKGLDSKIQKEAEKKEKQQDILDDRKSQRSQSAYSRVSAARSVRSRGGLSEAGLNALNAENRSRGGVAENGALSRASRSQGPRSQVQSMRSGKTKSVANYSEIDENDEWVAIQKFNTLLHYEEQKQSLLREAERKRLIKDELDRQIMAKRERNQGEKQENKMYDEMHEEHGKLLEQREIEKANAVKEKIMNDKNSRDQQLRDEKRRKKMEEKENMNQEQEYIKRLQSEMEQERQMQQEKRKQEREYLQKMLEENQRNKKRQKNDEESQRLEDLKAQEEYSKMLEKQEADRQNEMKERERRAQEFMNKMADNVLQKMDQKQKFEDDMLLRYENEREMRQRQIEDRRMQRQKQDQEKMRNFLAQQIKEKDDREKRDKANIDQQAQMWDLDKKNYDDEEKRLKERIGKINSDNAQYLLNQMAAKNKKVSTAKMHPGEKSLNKPLLQQVNQKLKLDGDSRRSQGVPSQVNE